MVQENTKIYFYYTDVAGHIKLLKQTLSSLLSRQPFFNKICVKFKTECNKELLLLNFKGTVSFFLLEAMGKYSKLDESISMR